MKQLFTHYYRTNKWRNKESVSGPGSTMAYTKHIRKILPLLVRDLNVSVVFDAPCGDGNWMRSVAWGEGVKYIGADIVDALVERNQELSGNGATEFLNMDITTDDFPQAGLWLCRDCLIHFSYSDIWRAIKNFLKSDIPYLLASTCSDCHENRDISTGGARHINLQLPPFNFGKPLMVIMDRIPGDPWKQLALWEAADLRTVGVTT